MVAISKNELTIAHLAGHCKQRPAEEVRRIFENGIIGEEIQRHTSELLRKRKESLDIGLWLKLN